MNKIEKILFRILNGGNDSNIDFSELVNLLIYFGFNERIKGSHHIFTKSKVNEIINIQPNENNKCKAYQVKHLEI